MRTPTHCRHCNRALGAVYLTVNSAEVCAAFHVDGCFPAYLAGVVPVDRRLAIADAESVLGIEHRFIEMIAPRPSEDLVQATVAPVLASVRSSQSSAGGGR